MSNAPSRPPREAYLPETIAHVASRLLALVGALALQWLAIRLLAPEVYGRFAGVLAWITMLEGYMLARNYEQALQRGGGMPCDWRAWRFAAVLALGLLALAWGAGGRLQISWMACLFLGAALPLQADAGQLKAILSLRGAWGPLNRAEGLSTALRLGGSCILLLGFGLTGLLVAYPLSGALRRWLLARAVRLQASEAPPQQAAPAEPPAAELRLVLLHASQNLDLVLFNMLASGEAVALFKVAKSLAMLPVQAALPIWQTFRPRMALAAQEPERVRELALKPIPLLAGGLLLALPALWLGPLAIAPLYGASYRDAAGPGALLFLGLWSAMILGGGAQWSLVVLRRPLSALLPWLASCGILAIGAFWPLDATPLSWAAVCALSGLSAALVAWGLMRRALRRQAC